MKMRIDLGKYVITHSAGQFDLNIKRTLKTGENEEQEQLISIAYFYTLYELVNKIIILDLNHDDIETLQQLSNKIENISRDIARKLREIRHYEINKPAD
ncbi:hypothetical protein GPY51_10815 [Photorhabdus laumondii subsp. laumondii]|uniref:Photorhabdus luminescens subsp. laumondii TTO1 complete genome segment 10/17 n=2 Tax=Photorhabdus laumondii subsp. laumondii TaxID=141679 RepID=Q7N2X8_PHOLL|nr:hypothetical protein [Photorhabdus laumondii]AWK42655.1 hypothetical protein A4R40_14715 [Photorhabdus laumondii subsp. laumondii]AXG47978.1 hypothetical protein PluTT01m_15135 [Photorhabdus laumondii subsp. laumondii]MCC8384634.1 hypothetical protein [Photorhabdus laumondii]MCC8413320.1 hypothetical protein [Photorhabdus laumondii]NDK94985.1 hypothetical protein [Photorhabdus laumondii subsp. laumondii]